MDNVNLFFTKKCIPTTKGNKTEHTSGHPTDNAMKSNFEKLCKRLAEQVNCLQRMTFMQKCVHLQKKIYMFNA